MTKKKTDKTSDIGAILDSGIEIIAKEVKRLSDKQAAKAGGLTEQDASLLTDYLKTLATINKEFQKEEKNYSMDLTQRSPEELEQLIIELEQDE